MLLAIKLSCQASEGKAYARLIEVLLVWSLGQLPDVHRDWIQLNVSVCSTVSGVDACNLQLHLCARMQEHLSLCLHELKQVAYNQLQNLGQPSGSAYLSDEATRVLFVKRLLLLLVQHLSINHSVPADKCPVFMPA